MHIEEKITWHRLLAIALTDYFTDTAYQVESEKDLSVIQQFLDILIIRRFEGYLPEESADGLEELAEHNLMTYKSHQEALDGWAMNELVGHYVSYRKSVSPKNKFVPEECFRLYAVSTRFPKNLSVSVTLKEYKKGIYDVTWGNLGIRLIVLSRVSPDRRNAIWHLFSAIPEAVRQGADTYRWRRKDLSTVMNTLFVKYRAEGFAMPYTVEDYKRDIAMDYLESLPADEVLKRYSAEEVLKRYSADEVLKRYSTEEVLKRYSADEVLRRYSADEVLKALLKNCSPGKRKKIEALIKALQDTEDEI